MATLLTTEESKRGIRLSEMTPALQDQVEKLGIDEDGDGKITGKEMEKLIESYLDTKKDNTFLRHLVTVLVIFSFLLTGCVFGASITATRLSKDTAVDPVNGIMYAKGSETPIQTEAVAIRNNGVIVNDMNTKELDALDEISLDNGSMKFQVKGYAKSVEKNQVALLVEGGSSIYGQEGLVAATGMAETMFNVVYPDDTVSVKEGVRRLSRRPVRKPRGLASVTDDENEEGVRRTLRVLNAKKTTNTKSSFMADDSPHSCTMTKDCRQAKLGMCYYGDGESANPLSGNEKCGDYKGRCFCKKLHTASKNPTKKPTEAPLFKDWGVSRTWCRSDLDEEIVGLTTPEECWVKCWKDYPTTVAIDFGNGICFCQSSCRCMAYEDYEATVYALESVVFPSECVDDGDDGDDGDDDLITEVPESLTFSIENDETNSDDVCTTGCEGDYSVIIDAVSNLWDEQGAEYEIFFVPQGRYAVVVGVIAANFPYRVRDLYLNHPEVDTLILVNVPGSADDNKLVIGAELVHSFGYQTCVPSVGLVSSGGTDLFTAGVKRFATPGAMIGIHSWASGDNVGNEYPREHQVHSMFLQFYWQISIPEDFYWETLSYGLPMHDITEEEITTKFPYLRDCSL